MINEEYGIFVEKLAKLESLVDENSYNLAYTEPELLNEGSVFLLIDVEEDKVYYVEEEDSYDVRLDKDGNANAEDTFNMVYTALAKTVVNKLIQEKRG